jgi:hypothetical protein
MTMLRPLLLASATALLLSACSGGDGGGGGAPPLDSLPAARPAPAVAGGAAPAGMTEAGEQAYRDSLRADSLAWVASETELLRKRTASMQPFAECMAQARTLPQAPRAQVEAACRNLPDAPK